MYSFLFLCSALLTGGPFFTAKVFGETSGPLNFPSTARILDQTQLMSLQSNQDLLAFYRSFLVSKLQLSDTLPLLTKKRKNQRSTRAIPAPSLLVPALNLTKSFVLWQQADRLEKLIIHGNHEDLKEGLETIQSNRDWVLKDLTTALFQETDGIINTLKVFTKKLSPSYIPSEEYHQFAAYLDNRYPKFIGHENSWLQIAAQNKTTEMENRFHSYWEEYPGSGLEKDSSIPRYFNSRLQRILHARLISLSLHMKIEAEKIGTRAWKELSTWKENWSHQRGLLRLCGTWKWVIHNHQNHADHKMTLTFPHPQASENSEVLPAKILTIGDVVYFRWEFTGGMQEDSLLFSKKDMRLEGTFHNTTGPRGNVSGSKIKPCYYPTKTEK